VNRATVGRAEPGSALPEVKSLNVRHSQRRTLQKKTPNSNPLTRPGISIEAANVVKPQPGFGAGAPKGRLRLR